MLIPSDTLPGTRAEGQLLRTCWARYVKARLLCGDDRPFGDASAVFEESVLVQMRSLLSEEVLKTPVFFTEKLSNRVLAACMKREDSSHIIAINARFKVDPEVLAHTLLEEFVHAQQILDKVDFETQRQQYAYEERPYEQEAKRLATAIIGYTPNPYENYLLRDAPEGMLFDDV